MDYAIGDIHGCLDKIQRLLDVLRYDPAADRLLFLGDYIDRGPQSKGVIELLCHLQRENPANVFLMGNHEENLLQYVHACLHDEYDLPWRVEPFFAGGGVATLASYAPGVGNPYDARLVQEIPPEHLQFMAHLPLWHLEGAYLLVHAGVRPGIPLEQQRATDLLRIRDPFLSTPHGLDQYVIFGHTPFRHVKREADKIGIDTGACYTQNGYGKLTAFCLQTQHTFQVI